MTDPESGSLNMEDTSKTYRASRFINRRIFLLLLLFAVGEAVIILKKIGQVSIPDYVIKSMETVLISTAVLLAVTIIIKFTESRVFHLLENEVEIEGRIFLTKIYTFFLYALAVAVVLSQLGVSAQNITIFLGFLATGMAMAVRDLIISYLVWLIILVKKPFRIGDYISVEGICGKVERIGTYYVTLSDAYGDPGNIRLPVKIFIDRPVRNLGREGIVRESVSIKIRRMPGDTEKMAARFASMMEKESGAGSRPEAGLSPAADGIMVTAVVTAPVTAIRNEKARALRILAGIFRKYL